MSTTTRKERKRRENPIIERIKRGMCYNKSSTSIRVDLFLSEQQQEQLTEYEIGHYPIYYIWNERREQIGKSAKKLPSFLLKVGPGFIFYESSPIS